MYEGRGGHDESHAGGMDRHVRICERQLDTPTQAGAVGLRAVAIVHLRPGRCVWWRYTHRKESQGLFQAGRLERHKVGMQRFWVCDQQLHTPTQPETVGCWGVAILHLMPSICVWEETKRLKDSHDLSKAGEWDRHERLACCMSVFVISSCTRTRSLGWSGVGLLPGHPRAGHITDLRSHLLSGAPPHRECPLCHQTRPRPAPAEHAAGPEQEPARGDRHQHT